MRILLWCALAALVGCANPDLTEAHKKQDQLKGELVELKREVARLKAEMAATGMKVNKKGGANKGKAKAGKAKAGKAKAGKAKGAAKPAEGVLGHQSPKTVVDLGTSAQRTGEAPAMPALSAPERTDSPCGWKYKLEDLRHFSDFQLNSAGMGKSSPLVLLENGAPMASHAMPAAYEKACEGAFRHAGHAVFFSPSETSDISDKTYSLQLADEVPLPRGDDDRPMYWVYPGTKLVFSFAKGWDPAWGEAKVDFQMKAIGPEATPAKVSIAGTVTEASPDLTTLSTDLETDQPWTLEIEVPADGAYYLIDLLTVGNSEHAAVVTGRRAWRREQKLQQGK